MNKKMRELLAKIDQLTKQARAFMDGETPDLAKATELMDQVDGLKKEYELEKRVYEQEKTDNVPENEVTAAQDEKKSAIDPLIAFGKAVKNHFRVNKDLTGILNEGTDADGGYTVPEDIQTRVNKWREAEFSLIQLVRREKVTTDTGARTFKKRAQYTGFTQVDEGGVIGATATPKFERITYAIKKYAGYMPLTNELRKDSDANVAQVVIEWLGNESRATANNLILGAIATKAQTDLGDLDGIKRALNVTLGAAFKATSKIITNDDGLQYLVVVVPNNFLASTPTYSASTDTTVTSGKTYYTLSNGVYTAVASPTGNPSTSSYYEMDPTPKIPFIIGDLNEGIIYWDRELMSIAESSVAAIGQLNAFEQDLTIYRAIEREDVKVRDAAAFVNGYIQPAAGE